MIQNWYLLILGVTLTGLLKSDELSATNAASDSRNTTAMPTSILATTMEDSNTYTSSNVDINNTNSKDKVDNGTTVAVDKNELSATNVTSDSENTTAMATSILATTIEDSNTSNVTSSNTSINNTSTDTVDRSELLALRTKFRIIFYRYAFSIILAIGIASNIINLAVLYRTNGLSGSIHLCLKYLSLFDLFALIVRIPICSLKYLNWDYQAVYFIAWWHAHMQYFLLNWSAFASNWLLMFIALERLVAIAFPFYFKKMFTMHKTHVFALLFFVLGIPQAIVFTFHLTVIEQVTESNVTFYRIMPSSSVKIGLYMQQLVMPIIQVGLPLLIITIANAIIIVKLRAISRNGVMICGKSAQNLKKNRITVTMIVVCIIFIITQILDVLRYYKPVVHLEPIEKYLTEKPWRFMEIYNMVHNVLKIVNYTANFFIYFITIKEYRQGLKNIFCKLSPVMSESVNRGITVSPRTNETSLSNQSPVT